MFHFLRKLVILNVVNQRSTPEGAKVNVKDFFTL